MINYASHHLRPLTGESATRLKLDRDNTDTSTRAGRLDSIWPVLNNLFVIDDQDEVFAFLNKETQAAIALIDAYTKLEAVFGGDTVIYLVVEQDPEEAGYSTLFGYIKTALPVKEALDKLEQFDTWYIENIETRNLNLNFDIL